MAIQGSLLVGLLVMVNLAIHVSSSLNRSSFPSDFLFGAASAAYQYEGAANEDGKGASIWDTFAHTPGKISDNSTGDVAIDFYHRYKDDVTLMKQVGLDVFRFSISWPRILPRGKLSGGVNKKGIAFYNDLINELLSKGIQPLVTLFHWDLPQTLEDEYGGFLSPLIVDDFRDFAEICFKEFGDRVKLWASINEPWTFTLHGYDTGFGPPGRCSAWMGSRCTAGNSGTEPYAVGHNMLLTHAATAKLYREKYKASQKGQIGIVLVSHWMVPYSQKSDDKAAQRAIDFMYGWFLHPLTYGEYPKSMRAIVGRRLPKFTSEEVSMVKGSLDFLGLNYYTGIYASDIPFSNSVNNSYSTDSHTNLTSVRKGKPIGEPTGVRIFFDYPRGLRELLVYTKEKYNNPEIYITECGMGDFNISNVKEGIKDVERVEFYRGHVLAVRRAINDGVKVKSFIAWSFLDNFEWVSGYTIRFGIGYIDYNDGLKRYLKYSALWFKKFLKK